MEHFIFIAVKLVFSGTSRQQRVANSCKNPHSAPASPPPPSPSFSWLFDEGCLIEMAFSIVKHAEPWQSACLRARCMHVAGPGCTGLLSGLNHFFFFFLLNVCRPLFKQRGCEKRKGKVCGRVRWDFSLKGSLCSTDQPLRKHSVPSGAGTGRLHLERYQIF